MLRRVLILSLALLYELGLCQRQAVTLHAAPTSVAGLACQELGQWHLQEGW